MKCIFLDNFRGFTKTILPLKDVNFLVGENSTGKTSVLALIKLMTDPHFWLGGTTAFGSEEIKLGNYRDIVSASVKDRSYFRIGLFVGGEGTENESPIAYLITFKEKEGMPFISRYTLVLEGQQIQVKFTSKKILYKSESKYRLSSSRPEEIEDMFNTWIREHEKSSGKYKTLKGPVSLLGTSLGVLNAVLSSGFKPSEKKVIGFDGRGLRITWGAVFKNVIMLAPIRTSPKSTYDEYNTEFSPEGAHTPYRIKKYFRKRREREQFLQYINRFGEDSGLLTTIAIKNYGRNVTSPFELDIALDGTLLKIVNVGYGVSQILPVIVEVFEKAEDVCFLIQQPEIHLHPRAQYALGNLFYELATLGRKSFIVETHSDFIIDSFRFRYRNKEENIKPEGQILYFERFEEGNRLFSIDILENGELPEEQPEGYRDFFIREQMRMLGY